MSGGRWGFIRSLALQATGILTTAVLARLITEEDFGMVAITVMVVTMFTLITSVGLGASLVRRQELTDGITSTFFWASLIIGVITAAGAAALSRPAATLAGSVDAAPLIAVAALTLPLNLLSRVPSSLLTRDLRFRSLAIVHIGGSIVHGLVAVTLAFLGFGAWSVVIGQLCRSVWILGGSMYAARFRPRAIFEREEFKEDLSFSLGFLGADLVNYANKNADYWYVGNRLGTAQLGIYYVAYVIPTLLRQRITAIGLEVMYPVVAKIQDNVKRITTAYLRVVRLIAFAVLPSMLGLAVVADLAIGIGFGPGWEAAVDPLRIISVSAAVASLTVVAHPIFPAMGRPLDLVTAGLVSLGGLAVGLAVSDFVGSLESVALAVLAAMLIGAVVIQTKLRRLIGVRHRVFLSAVRPFALSSLAMAASVWGIKLALAGLPELLRAAVVVPVGAGTYLLAGRLFFKEQFAAQLSTVKSLLRPSAG